MPSDTDYLFASPATPHRDAKATVNYRMGLNLLSYLIGTGHADAGHPGATAHLQALFPLALMAAERIEGLPVTNDSLLRQCASAPDAIHVSPSRELPADRLAETIEYLSTHSSSQAAAIAQLRPLLPHQGFLVTPAGIPLALFAPLRHRAHRFFGEPGSGTVVESAANLLAEAFVILASSAPEPLTPKTIPIPRAASIVTLLNSEFDRVSHLVSICPDGQARETITSFLSTNDPRRLEALAIIVTDALFTEFP